jgi:probable rRNA maturation factor
MVEILNRQRKVKLEAESFYDIASSALRSVESASGRDVTIAFVSDRRMRELNGAFRSKRKTTDVLSFPFEPDHFDTGDAKNFLGDIIISAEQAARQAAENNLPLRSEISQLILHGILHLCGYDHETDNGEMNEFELKLRDALQI